MKSISAFALSTSMLVLLVGCGGSAPSALELGERTPVQIGVTGVTMDLDIVEPGFYSIYTDGEEDTVCSISDDAGLELAEDDDGGEGFNCLISTVLEAGTYGVQVRGYDITERGTTHVTVEKLASRSIAAGDVVNLEIEQMRGSVLDLTIERAGTYRLGTSGMFDTECWLYDASGNELDYNDDFGNDQNCGMIKPLQSGQYHVLVRGYGGSAGSTAFIASQTQVREVSMALDNPIADRLNDGEDLIDFEVTVDQAGRYVFFTTGDTDTYCELRAADGEMLGYNDDGDDHNCRIQHALSPGEYRFNVRGYRGATGAFTAQVNRR